MKVTSSRAMRIPDPPRPWAPPLAIAHLEMLMRDYPVGDTPIYVNGQEVVNAKVVNGAIVLQTYKDMLNEHPPCANHNPVQHRDGKPPWCYICRLTADWEQP